MEKHYAARNAYGLRSVKLKELLDQRDNEKSGKELLDQRDNENSGKDFVFRVDGTPMQRAQVFKYLRRKVSENGDDRFTIHWNIRT